MWHSELVVAATSRLYGYRFYFSRIVSKFAGRQREAVMLNARIVSKFAGRQREAVILNARIVSKFAGGKAQGGRL